MKACSKKLAVVGCVAAVVSGCLPMQPEPEARLATTTTAVVKPLYDDFSTSLTQLSEHAESFCQNPSDKRLTEIRSSWREAMGRWQAAGVVNFGPVTVGSVAWKFQFWPDRKNLIRKKIEVALDSASKGEKEWSAANIAKASVVGRGLGAVEYLVFDPDVGSRIGEPVRCQYLLAVVGDMQRNAKRLSKGWQEGDKRYPVELKELATIADGDTEEYFQVSGLLVNSLYAYLETSLRKLRMPYGKADSESGNAYLAESWRSQNSLNNLRASISSANQLYLGGGLSEDNYGLDDRLSGIDPEGMEIAKSVRLAFKDVQTILASDVLSNTTLEEAVNTPEGRKSVSELIDAMNNLKNLFVGKVPNKLGIPLGFNSNDGD